MKNKSNDVLFLGTEKKEKEQKELTKVQSELTI
jgi:hypothetical protein